MQIDFGASLAHEAISGLTDKNQPWPEVNLPNRAKDLWRTVPAARSDFRACCQPPKEGTECTQGEVKWCLSHWNHQKCHLPGDSK